MLQRLLEPLMAPEIDVGHYGLNVRRPLSGSLSEETKATLHRESVAETAYSWAETTFLVAAGAVGGVGTGLKAIANQSAKAVGSLVSLGYWEAGDVLPVNEGDLGYDQAALPARIGSESALAAATLGLSVSRVGMAAKVGQGLTILDARPAGPGYWGKRTPQKDAAVDAFELKINPNNESFYLPHPEGGFVQFENVVGTSLKDGKLVTDARSFYKPSTIDPKFRSIAEKKVIAEAQRQVKAASAHGFEVEWLVSDKAAAQELTALMKRDGVNIKVTEFAK